MPRRYWAKKKKKYVPRKRTNYRRRPRNTNIMGYVSGMPKTRRARLRYADTISLTSTFGAIGQHHFVANACHDPDVTGTGHQPMGWDNWKALYNHYVVVGSKITVKIMAGDGVSTPDAAIQGCFLNDNTTLPYTTADGYIESKKGSYRTLSFDRKTLTYHTNYSAKNFFNLSDIKDNVNRIGADIASNPTETANFSLYFFDLTGSTSTIRCMIVIDYIVDFSEPIDMLQS